MKKKVCKVPMIMQMEALECGAASLAMVLAYYNKWIPLSKVREDCGVSRDGSNAVSILKVARDYGMLAKGYRYTVEEVQESHFPVIIHWNFNHFVVLNGFKNKKAVINDPAQGTTEVSMEDFKNSFTGIVLSFEKSETFVADGQRKSTLDFAKTRLKGTSIAFIFIILTSIITQVLGIVNPLFSKVFMDNILGQGRIDWLRPLLFMMSIVLVMQLMNNLVHTLYMLKIRGKLSIVANTTFMWHVLRLPIQFFSQRYAGDISQRQGSNEKIAETLINQLAPMLLNFMMIIFYLCIMLYYSPMLTFIGLLTVALNMSVSQYISKKRVDITRKKMRDASNLFSVTLSGIEMIETIKSSGSEDGFFEKWAGHQASANNATVETTKINQFLGNIPGIILQIANGAILISGAYLIIMGEFTVGTLLAFQSYMSSFMSPVNSMIGVMQSVQEMRTSMERIDDVMEYKPDVAYAINENEVDKSYEKLQGEIEIKNLTFGYNRFLPPLIDHFSLSIQKGGKVAFVGASGCGKSTLSKLISNLYQPWSGDICFDKKSASEIDRIVFSDSLGVVDQSIILFTDSVRDNVSMWDKFTKEEDIIKALKDAQIYDDIMKLEGGLSYQLSEGGKNFSGGQRQRLEIACVLATNPSIIILDEATSALDAKTEEEVINAINTRGITTIVVAHRLSTIRDCDEIIVFDKGKVVERGTHKELYSKNGYYTALVTNE